MSEDVEFCKNCFHSKSLHFEPARPNGSICDVVNCTCNAFVLGETRVTSATGASKGTKDARYDLIPIPALDELAKLYGFGTKKYAAHNWRLGYEWSLSYAAAQRHMAAFWSGEDIDPESGAPHVISAAFHMFALATFLKEHPELDDRFETRGSRSDEGPKTHFFQVRSKRYADGWVGEGFYLSADKAQQRIEELRSEISVEDHDTEFEVFEGVFQDG